jgi:hypothetical protein
MSTHPLYLVSNLVITIQPYCDWDIIKEKGRRHAEYKTDDDYQDIAPPLGEINN